MRTLLPFLAVALMAAPFATAQTPSPVIIQAITPQAQPATAPAQTAAAASNNAADDSGVRLLMQIKAANEELLKRQEAVLKQLDELEAAAEQIRIYSKRG